MKIRAQGQPSFGIHKELIGWMHVFSGEGPENYVTKETTASILENEVLSPHEKNDPVLFALKRLFFQGP
jgi:hypothetical protein